MSPQKMTQLWHPVAIHLDCQAQLGRTDRQHLILCTKWLVPTEGANVWDVGKQFHPVIYIYIYIQIHHYICTITGKHLVLPALVGGHLHMCWKRGKNVSFFCIMANFMLYTGTHSIGTCANLLLIIIIIIIIIIIKPLLKIFNECRSLTGVGELNPYWRSSMNVEV